MKIRTLAFISAVLFCSTPWAIPAPWYQWRSKLNGEEVCAQTMPSDGWEKARGPFKDASCLKRGVPQG